MSYYLPLDDSEEALRADNYLDSLYYHGSVVTIDQEHAWPRTGVSYYDARRNMIVSLDREAIPREMAAAALLLVEHYVRYPDAGGVEPRWDSISLGPLSLSNSTPGTDARPIPTAPLTVTKLLRPLLRSITEETTWWRTN